MNLKDRFKTYRFWLSIASAVFILFQAIAKPLGLQLSEDVYMSLVNGVLGIFVVVGLISDPVKKVKETGEEDSGEEDESEDKKQGE